VIKVEEVGQALEVAEALGRALQPVVAKVEHAQLSEPPDLLGDLGKAVVRQHLGFEFLVPPNPGRDLAGASFSKDRVRTGEPPSPMRL
jgi:hypothetical protein